MLRSNPSADQGHSGTVEPEDPVTEFALPGTAGGIVTTSPGSPSLCQSDPYAAEQASAKLSGKACLDTVETTLIAKASLRFAATDRALSQVLLEINPYPGEWYAKAKKSLQECGKHWWIYKLDGEARLFPSLCRHRMCPNCNAVRAWKLQKNLQARIDQMQRPKMLTLTLARRDGSFAGQLSAIRKAFVRLRARKVWADKVLGGVWVLEYTLRPGDHSYNVHLHCVIDCPYWAWAEISALWLQITGDSWSVCIKSVGPHTAAYLCKYLAKNGRTFPSGAAFHDHFYALKGVRFHGSWKSPKPVIDQPLIASELERVMPLWEAISRASYGDADAQSLLNELHYRLCVLPVDWELPEFHPPARLHQPWS